MQFHTGCLCGSLQEEAFAAYSERQFDQAARSLSQLIEREPAVPRWLEMRAQVQH